MTEFTLAEIRDGKREAFRCTNKQPERIEAAPNIYAEYMRVMEGLKDFDGIPFVEDASLKPGMLAFRLRGEVVHLRGPMEVA